MASYHSFYSGANYGLDPNYGELFKDAKIGYRFPTSTFGFPTDPRTANQIQAVSNKLNTGAKTIEVSGITTQVLESIPEQHLKEINRIKKLAGVNLTFHGPLIEPTGMGEGQRSFDETQRKFAERQISSAVKRAHKLDPEGNIVVTLHSSQGLPAPEMKVITEDGKEVTANLAVINERTGQFGVLSKPREDYFKEKATGVKRPEATDELDRINQENWTENLSGITMNLSRSKQAIRGALSRGGEYKGEESEEEWKKKYLDLYALSKTDPQQYQLAKKALEEKGRDIEARTDNLTDAANYLQDSYRSFKEMFNQAYSSANQEQKNKLDKYAEDVAADMEKMKNDPLKIDKFVDKVNEGVNLLSNMFSAGGAPQMFKPLKEFAIGKAAETFSNVAFDAYKEYGTKAPIISIENPPAGSGLSRGEELKELVKATREKFIQKLKEEKGLSESDAKREAEKLIGVTWDVGHINMIRKFGYKEEQIAEETKKVAPYIKHIHLSDNFGLDHTELPMGMGNVPMKKHLDVLKKQFGDKLKEIKQIVETGNWFEPFKKTPFMETLSAFGSPIYSMEMAPYWNQAAGTSGGYLAGRGMNPDVHHSIYGAGFSNLPVELGGQMAGRARMGGAPIE